jgi:polysaccharide export outer membrane protein
MRASTLVVLAVVSLCAGPLRAQQTTPPNPNSTLTSSTGNGPSVTVPPDQVRPAENAPGDASRVDSSKKEDKGATTPATDSPGTQPAAAPNEPILNPEGNPILGPDGRVLKTEKETKALPVQDRPYVIGPLDVLEIRVWNDPKLSGMYSVRPDGMIAFPLIGELKADGFTVPGLTQIVRQKLLAVMNDPNVNIQVAKINSKRVFVFGGVQRPGEMGLVENMTVLDALSNVGFKDFANVKKIVIVRGNERFRFNYKDAIKGKHMEQNIYLQNGDRIFVPE